MFRTLKAILCPFPASPSRFSTGTFASSRMTCAVEEPFNPIFSSSGPTETPGNRLSTRNAENRFPSIFANTVNRSANAALVMNFTPFSRKWRPSSDNLAVVLALSGSLPQSGSVRQYAPIHSPEVSKPRYRFFWSSVP